LKQFKNDDVPEINKARFLFLGLNYRPEIIGIGKYNTEMIDWLAQKGHPCTVVTAYPYYPYWEVQKPYKNLFYKKESAANGMISVYRCPFYVPKKPTGAKRMLQEATFFITSLLVMVQLLFSKKYDYVLTVAPPFHLGLIALLFKWIRGTKVIYHIQDLQIDAAKELNMLKGGPVISAMMSVERFILKRSDFVSTISPGMIRKTLNKVNRKVISFPNWVDVTRNYPLGDKRGLKKEWGLDEDDFVVLYSGSLGEKQGLSLILDVAEKILNPHVKFIVCGNGAHKESLVKRAAQKNLNNVTFLPLQARERFNSFLNMADLHLILQKKNASDLVMPSKLTTILAVGGVAVVTANPGTSLHTVVALNNIGLVAEPENETVLVDVIRRNIDSDNSRIQTNARHYAERRLSIDYVMNDFLNQIAAAEPDQELVKYISMNDRVVTTKME
jgi:colanic acid biosynthesis glycosyl transferase WcaI